MKRARLLAAVAMSVWAGYGPATAADAITNAPPASPSVDWTGFYVGGHVGYAAGWSDWSAAGAAPSSNGSLDFFNPYDAFKGTGSFFAGLQAGYNYLLPSRMLFGFEVDSSFPNSIGGDQIIPAASRSLADFGETVLLSGTVRGRVGYAFDNWLLYGTAGFAWTYDQLARTQLTAAPGAVPGGGTTEQALLWRLGVALGAGVEIPLARNWTVKAEYLWTDFGRSTVTFPAAGQTFNSDLTVGSVRLGLNYRIGEDLTKSDIATAGPSALDFNNFSFHGQTTFVGQYALPFHAPYSGPNSLESNAGRETWDVTFYAGARLWDGAELWVNPEIDQGFGLTGTLGVAGFPNAEAYKVGDSYPYARLPRMFIRQTIDLGGETQKVEESINQFAGSQTADRLVITIGKFSVVDIFDTNKYAHDPRGDFLNWALVDTGTFDYAADAWAYTYGAAVEWYKDSWTLRGGIFDLSIAPNTANLDPSFGQFQWVGEIEHRHELFGQPGKIAITGFLSRGRMGSFEDAIELAQLTGGPADIAAVRQYGSRGGVSLNLEQQVADGFGVFARAGIANGNIEPFEFTDIDRTVAAGLSLSGKAWNRPDDTFGLAGVVNGITGVHEAFLNDGGLGILVGDGILPHPGPEQIMETYYSLPFFSWHATFDYQFIVNPAYNRDRGPVSVISTRLHAQF